MSLSPDDFIQVTTGNTTGVTSTTVTLPSATAEGNTVLICMMSTASSNPTASGFTRDHGASAGNPRPFILRKADVTGGESSWTVLGLLSLPAVWVAIEVQGLHPQAPRDVIQGALSATASTTSVSTGTTPTSTVYEGMAVCFWGAMNTANSTVPTFTLPTDGRTEAIATSSRTDGATATACAVAIMRMYGPQTWESTATLNVTCNVSGSIALYVPIGARRAPNLEVMSGFETGTVAGLTTGNAGGPAWDTQSGSPTIVSTSPRTGSYHLRLNATAGPCNVTWTNTGALSLYANPSGYFDRTYITARFSVRFPTSLPGADVMLAAIDAGSDATGNGLYLAYRTASQKLALYVRDNVVPTSSGDVLSATTVAANTWYDIDLLYDFANASRAGEFKGWWHLDAVEQTTAVVASSSVGSILAATSIRLGWQGNSTAQVFYDDVAVSRLPGHYPLRSVKIYPLPLDTGATPTVTTGTAFSTFTNNGTLNATFSTTTARDAVDEVPVTIGGTADGFVQDTIGATDYVEVPMTTRDAAANLQAIRGVRWYFPGWANSASAPTNATIGLRAYDGTAETTLFAAADPAFTTSTTAPGWISRMHRALTSSTPYVWTQPKLDALAARVGFSTDVTPVVGVHAVFAEVAMVDAVEQQMAEYDGMFIYGVNDPDSGQPMAMRLVAAPDAGASADYVISGTPVTRTAPAGGQDLYTLPVGTVLDSHGNLIRI